MSSRDAIYLIDRDPASAKSIEAILSDHGFSVHMFASGGSFMDDLSIAETGCVVANSCSSFELCIEIQKELLWRGSDLAIILLSPHRYAGTHSRSSKYALITTLEVPFTPDALITVVKASMEKSLLRQANRIRQDEIQRRLNQLTESEKSVLKALVKGFSHKNISRQLGISPRSVDRRRQSILSKMNVTTLQELIGTLAEIQFGQ